ncbi:MAG: hypothetical protein ACHQRM_03440 [Bacteroidia bacterium]
MKKGIVAVVSLAVILTAAAFKNAGPAKGVTIINTVDVNDFATFKQAFDAGAPIREKAGIKVTALFQAVDNANRITVMEEAASAESAKAFFADPKAKEAMEKAGVNSKPDLKILNKIQ